MSYELKLKKGSAVRGLPFRFVVMFLLALSFS